MSRIEIYTTNYCGYCVAAKRLLSSKGLAYEEIDVTHDPERRDWLVRETGQHTVPQIFIDGQSVGGYDQLAKLDRAGRLPSASPQPG
jgi:glutaredoxin 3